MPDTCEGPDYDRAGGAARGPEVWRQGTVEAVFENPAIVARPGKQHWRVVHAHALERLPTMASGSVNAVVIDPPYGISIDNRHWDGRNIHHALLATGATRLSQGQASSWGTRTPDLQDISGLPISAVLEAIAAHRRRLS
jgi:hypothetical protein